LHISQICSDRNQKVDAVLSEGQEIEVFVAGVDKQGRVKLEWKDKPAALVQPTLETATAEQTVEAEEKADAPSDE
jgi:polyribonucleotide nucleotidyltransferase